MNWFYANAGQQVGPINEADLDRLVREGVIQPATLVWREGMANWEPYSAIAPAPSPAPATVPLAATPVAEVPPGQVLCNECNKPVAAEEAMQINGRNICAACKPIYLQRMREGAAGAFVIPGARRYGGFWIRVVAKIIDSLIIGLPVMIIYVVAVFVFGFGVTPVGGPGTPPDFAALFASMGIQLAAQFIGVVLGGFYNVFFIVRYGATPGKMAVGLRVIMPDGGPLTVGRAIGRYFAEMLSGMICYIGYILACFDDQKRTLHDHICNTRVVYK